MEDVIDMGILEMLNDDCMESLQDLSAFLATTSDFANPMEASCSTRKRRITDKPKEELQYLRAKQFELTKKLQQLKANANLLAAKDSWKARAISQAQQAQRCRQENTRLKELVHEQLKVIQALERIVNKKPKLLSFPSSADSLWKQSILGIHDREDQLDRITQRQYDQLDSEWIRLGIYDAAERNERMRKSFITGDDTMTLNLVGTVTKPVKLNAIAEFFWDQRLGKIGPVCEIMTMVHPDLVYLREDLKLIDESMPILESRVVLRRYIEANRIVFVWKAIVQDELYPHESCNLIGDQAGWVVFEDKGNDECSFQLYLKLCTPIFPSNMVERQPAVGTWTELLLESIRQSKMKFAPHFEKAIKDCQSDPTIFTNYDMKSPPVQPMQILEVFHEDNGASFNDPMFIETMSAFLSNTADFSDPVSTSPPSSEAESPRRRNGKRPYQRPKKELEYLKKKHDELVVRLEKLQEKTKPDEPAGPWKTRAIEQAQSVQRSLIENTRLREMIQDQLNAIRAFERVLQKRPKLSDFPANEGLWRHAILGESNREADMEMLMKYQYDQLESILIREGLYNALETGEELRKSYVQSGENENTMRINFAGSKNVQLDFLAMGDVLWDHKITRTGVESEVIEILNPELVYVREDLTLPDPKMPLLEARIVIRKYVEVNRIVIVWRTIVEDRLFPHKEGNLIGIREGWNVIQATSGNECVMQMFVSTSTPIFPPALSSIQPAVGTLTELLLKATAENKIKFKSVLREAVAARQRLQLTSESESSIPICSFHNSE